MTYRTPEEAAKMACPIARITPDNKSKCVGPDCILWRWKPRLASDAEFIAAVKREEAVLAQADGTGKSGAVFHKKAVANVMRDPEGYGIASDRGYCGLAPVPT